MKRPIRIEGDIAYIPLTRGYEAVIDAADVPLVEGWNWTADIDLRRCDCSIRTVYARRNDYSEAKPRKVRMHRVIAGTPEGFETDHEDGDGLNNRRNNLRTATKGQNQHNGKIRITNTSGLKGVHFRKDIGKWHASITNDRKQKFLGSFRCPTAAHIAYVKASRELHGEFGRAA